MRLYEIVCERSDIGGIPMVDVKQEPKRGGKEIGQGVQATVHEFSNKPGAVVKYATLDGTDDPYLQFVQLAKKNQDNPFFPRISNAKILKLPDSTMLIVQMEKLIPFDNAKVDSETILKSLGFESGGDHELQAIANAEGRKALFKRSKNAKFKQAIKLLAPYFDELEDDMHNGNVMIRMSSGKPQLVIIDPFLSIDRLDLDDFGDDYDEDDFMPMDGDEGYNDNEIGGW